MEFEDIKISSLIFWFICVINQTVGFNACLWQSTSPCAYLLEGYLIGILFYNIFHLFHLISTLKHKIKEIPQAETTFKSKINMKALFLSREIRFCLTNHLCNFKLYQATGGILRTRKNVFAWYPYRFVVSIIC